jgi:hypothetical protein
VTIPRAFVALDEGWADTVAAEHGARESVAALGLPVVSACTHVASDGDAARVVVTLELAGEPGDAPAASGLEAQVAAHANRESGRAFVFPGSELLTGVLTVAELVASSAVDEVAVVGGPPPEPGARVDTQAFVRPLHRAGRLVLHLRPAAGGYVPFEQPDPMECCTDHAPRVPGAADVSPG